MCGDREAQLPPALRRCAYGLLALVLLLDAIGSVMWGNPLASDVSFSVTESFSILLGNQLTSSIASQVVIALHFVYMSCRSGRGRGWAYASLRFELDECGKSMLMSAPMVATMTGSGMESGAAASAATPMLASDASARAELQHAGAARWNALSQLRQRWLQFQQRQVSRCRVFAVPCVAMRGAGGGGEAAFALGRPAFDLRLLGPLQRLVEAHLRLYCGFMFFFLVVPGFVCVTVFSLQSQFRGISLLVLNSMLCTMAFGFLSSKRYGLDRVAVKHVAQSFRFAIFVTLLATDVALNIRLVYTIDYHPSSVVAYAFASLLFCLCILLDCSPHLPPWVQIYISVNNNAMLRISVEHLLPSLQVGWCILYGYHTFDNFHKISAGRDLDCFLNLGAYKICAVTQSLSIYTSVLLLTTQALVSRMIVPGISNFVNASVRRSHPRARCGTSQRQHNDGFCDLCGALASRAAGPALGLKRWHGRNKRCGGRRR
jgi:hypothetical protein